MGRKGSERLVSKSWSLGTTQDLSGGGGREYPAVSTVDPSARRALLCALAFWLIPALLRPHLNPAEHPSREHREFWLNHSYNPTSLPCPALLTSSVLPWPFPWWIGFLPVSGHAAPLCWASISALSLKEQSSMDGSTENDTLVWPSLGLLFSGVAHRVKLQQACPPFMPGEIISWGPLTSILERRSLRQPLLAFCSQALSYLEFFESFSPGHFVCVCVQ